MSQRFQESLDWREALKAARKRRHVTQAELARRSGMSRAAIRAYETGDRHPRADSLKCITDALGLSLEEANVILGAAGYSVDQDAVFNAGFRAMSLSEMAAEAETCPWPAFITNLSYDVLFMIGLAKGDPRWRLDDPARPAPWLQVPLQRFLDGNPVRVRRFFELWETGAPIPHRLRQRFRMRWLYQGEVPMEFIGILSLGNFSDELHWNEWIPADTQTWQTLVEITSASEPSSKR